MYGSLNVENSQRRALWDHAVMSTIHDNQRKKVSRWVMSEEDDEKEESGG